MQYELTKLNEIVSCKIKLQKVVITWCHVTYKMSISLNIDLKLNTIHELEVITPLVFLFLKSCLILIKNMKGVKMSKKQYKSLDYNSRVVLEQLLKAGYSKKDIAVTIGVSYYTILRELKINNMTALTYNAQEAQKRKMKLRLEREKKIAENN